MPIPKEQGPFDAERVALASCIYLGFDPGATGGIAAVRGSEVLINKPMPSTEKDIWEFINLTGLHNAPRMAVIEQISTAIYGTDKSTQSKLYGNYAALRMACTAAGIAYETITPRKWQAGLGIAARKLEESDTVWKNRLKIKAQQLFPRATVTLATADAILISEYCRRRNLGLL